MFENFLFSVNIVLPMVLIAVLGYFLKRVGMLGESFVSNTSKLLFNVVVPLSIFNSIAYSDLSETFDLKQVLFTCISTIAVTVIVGLITPRIVKDRSRAATMVQAMYRGNFVILGMPLALSMFGEAGYAPALVMVPFVAGLYSTLAVILFNVMVPEAQGDQKLTPASLGKKLAKNPFIISAVVSMIFALLHLQPPAAVKSAISSVGSMASPLSLLMLGAQFELRQLKGNFKAVAGVTAMKLVVLPIIVLGIAAAMGFRGANLGALFGLYASPTAVASYIMARNMGGDGELAGQLVFVTTLCSAVTVMIGIFALKSFGLI